MYNFPKTTTLVYLLRTEGNVRQVLLARKKRGFGQGHWNGPGGKVQAGEEIVDAAKREVEEEVCLKVDDLTNVGFLEFVWADKPDWNQRCHVYTGQSFTGTPAETEECAPQWFDIDTIPLDQMWEDDPYWLPAVLRGGSVKKRFFFDADNKLSGMEDVD